jgi:hypothetical protein
MADIETLKRAALEFVIEESIAKLLLVAHFEVKEYGRLSRADPGGSWNMGVKNISTEDYLDEETNRRMKLTVFFAKDYKVKLGSLMIRPTNPNEHKLYERIKFFLFEDLILDLKYELLRDPKSPADYAIRSVEEFHKDDRTKIVLENIYKMILNRQVKEQDKIEKPEIKKSKEKFTF